MVVEKGSDIPYLSSNLPDTHSEVSDEVSDTSSNVSDIRTLSSFYGIVSEVRETGLMGGGLEISIDPIVLPTLPYTNCIDPIVNPTPQYTNCIDSTVNPTLPDTNCIDSTVNPTLQDTNLEGYLQHNISFMIPTILQDVEGKRIDPSFLQGETVTYSTKRFYTKIKDKEGAVHTKGVIHVHTGDFHDKEFIYDLG